jgi:hypothetical protein
MFGWGKKDRKRERSVAVELEESGEEKPSYGLPTIKFDPARVTSTVKADLRRNIKALADVDASQFEKIYDAALRCLSVGGAQHTLFQALMTIDRMSRERAGVITRSLNRKADAVMTVEQQQSLGIEYAIWRYAGAPCITKSKGSIKLELERDAAHKAASGKTFRVAKGMFLNGQWTHPGRPSVPMTMRHHPPGSLPLRA